MSAWFSFGSFLFVLLITDISCFPLQRGLPQGFPQSGSNTDGTDNFATHLGASSSHYSPALVPNAVPPSNIYTTGLNDGLNSPVYYRDPVAAAAISGPVAPHSGFNTGVSMPVQPVYGAGVSLPGQAGYAADSFGQPGYFASSPVSGQSGYVPGFTSATSSQPGAAASGSVPALPAVHAGPSRAALQGSLPGASQPKVTAQPEVRDIDWMVPPPNIFTSSKDTSAHSASHSHGPVHGHAEESPFSPGPSRPIYQPGELSHFEKNAESGNYQRETEEIGYLHASPPAPFLPTADLVFSPAGPRVGVGGFWDHPYPYFDYLFLSGQYPPGTVSHFSQNFEHGRDFYRDIHYNKEQPDSDSEVQSKQTPQQPDYV